MSECASLWVRRNGFRFALTGLVGVWLSGCSADVTRLSDPIGNPFSNPFSTASNDSAAPTPKVTSSPLASNNPNPNFVAAAHPSPVAVSALPTPEPSTTGQIRAAASAPVGGSTAGWSAVGGSPIIVGSGDSLDGLSRRYGVPTAALLKTNGLASAADVHTGMRMVVPVYNADNKSASSKAPKPEADVADAAPRKAKPEKVKHEKDAGASDAKPLVKAKEAKKVAEVAPAPRSLAKPDAVPGAKAASVAAAPKADPAKTSKSKPAVDATETGAVNAAAPSGGVEQADASGAPEFRWPARGRIIQGFKTGGNDGINISVPEGTSVRAAENGVVAYAGSELKGYGNLVLIRHPNGFVSAYANNGEIDVKRGETVKRGQVIAKSGQSGNVSSPQLHFELRKGSTPVDPTSYLAGL